MCGILSGATAMREGPAVLASEGMRAPVTHAGPAALQTEVNWNNKVNMYGRCGTQSSFDPLPGRLIKCYQLMTLVKGDMV